MVINIPDDNVLVIFMISLFVLFYSIQSRNVKKKFSLIIDLHQMSYF